MRLLHVEWKVALDDFYIWFTKKTQFSKMLRKSFALTGFANLGRSNDIASILLLSADNLKGVSDIWSDHTPKMLELIKSKKTRTDNLYYTYSIR